MCMVTTDHLQSGDFADGVLERDLHKMMTSQVDKVVADRKAKAKANSKKDK
jgi:hypothetical protein